MTLAPPRPTLLPAPGEPDACYLIDLSGWARGIHEVRRPLAGDHVERVELDGTLDPTTSRWELRGSVEGLEFSPRMRAALPRELARQSPGALLEVGLAQDYPHTKKDVDVDNRKGKQTSRWLGSGHGEN